MPLNSQHKRIRKNRVSITYDVETNGAMQSRELPFVVGVIGNLSGNRPDSQKTAIEDRQFIQVDQDNFDQVMSRIGPQLSLKVDNVLEEEGEPISCDLRFDKMQDFDPGELVRQIPVLEELVGVRNQLMSLLGKADRSRDLEKNLREVISNSELVTRLAEELGIDKPEGE